MTINLNLTTANDSNSAENFRYLALFSGCLLISICIFGIIGNLLSLIVFLHHSFRSRSINVLLAALSFTDFFLLSLGIPVFASAPLATFDPTWQLVDTVYSYSLVYVYPITVMFQFVSVWLLVLITLERWLAVCKPFMVETYCTRKRSVSAIGVVFTLAIALNMIRFWDFRLNQNNWPIPVLRNYTNYTLWYSTLTQLFILYIIPLFALLILNCQVILTITKARNIRRRLRSTVTQRSQDTTKMLLYVVIVFLFCYSMSFGLILIELFNPLWFSTEFGSAVSDFNNILAVLNSAVSFVFYFKFSTRYRRRALYLLTGNNHFQLEDITRMLTSPLITTTSTRRSLPIVVEQNVNLLNVSVSRRRRSSSCSGCLELEQRDSVYERAPNRTSRTAVLRRHITFECNETEAITLV